MTIKELKKKIARMPDDMEVMVRDGELCFPVCSEITDVVVLKDEEKCFMISQCLCEGEFEDEEFIDESLN